MHSSGMRYEDAVREFKKQYLRKCLWHTGETSARRLKNWACTATL
jgi:hypothetical protein